LLLHRKETMISFWREVEICNEDDTLYIQIKVLGIAMKYNQKVKMSEEGMEYTACYNRQIFQYYLFRRSILSQDCITIQ